MVQFCFFETVNPEIRERVLAALYKPSCVIDVADARMDGNG